MLGFTDLSAIPEQQSENSGWNENPTIACGHSVHRPTATASEYFPKDLKGCWIELKTKLSLKLVIFLDHTTIHNESLEFSQF